MQVADGEPTDPRAWVRVTRAIAARIDSGELRPAGPAPAIALLASELGVSRATATRAYRELAAQGILRRIPGHGYYLTASAPTASPSSSQDRGRQEMTRPGEAPEHRYRRQEQRN